jgi:hypothetical protein
MIESKIDLAGNISENKINLARKIVVEKVNVLHNIHNIVFKHSEEVDI